MNAGAGPFVGIIILLYLAIIGISIYCLVLFIKLAHRGIKALDIYISKSERGDNQYNSYNQYVKEESKDNNEGYAD
jgi:hypothetical protein